MPHQALTTYDGISQNRRKSARLRIHVAIYPRLLYLMARAQYGD
jgi:hypothetical protein